MTAYSRWLFLALLMACFAHAAYYYPQLPDTVASHFGASGQPDAWSGKSSFLRVYVVVTALCGVLFGLGGILLARLPVSLINLPNKNYWLSDAHKNETVSFLRDFLLLFGSATLALVLFTFHQAFRFSMGRTPSIEYMPVAIGIYVALALAANVTLFLRFFRKP